MGIPQHVVTALFKDNRGALFMANAQQTSNQTEHIDIKILALINWVEQDLMILTIIKTPDKCADTMTKAVLQTQ